VLPPGLYQGEFLKEIAWASYLFSVSDFLTCKQRICLMEKPDYYQMKDALEP